MGAVRISSFELEIPGAVRGRFTRYDKDTDTTTVTLTGEQAQAVHQALSSVAQFLGADDPVVAEK